MKKRLSLLLALILCACVLAACGSRKTATDAPGSAQGAPAAPEVTEVPQEGEHGEADQSAALEAMPTLEPVEPIADGENSGSPQDDYFSIDAMLAGADEGGANEAAAPADEPAVSDGGSAPAVNPVAAVDASAYQYSALTDTSLGFTFNYPSSWENVPGVFSVCFREKVEEGDFPARVTITSKKLVHSPDEEVITEQLTSYLRVVHKQYDAATFQAGTPNTTERFMGKPALSNTYLAFSGEHEVKGYIIGTAVGRTMYVFHFCATYEDYGAMENLMRYMANSAEIVEQQ